MVDRVAEITAAVAQHIQHLATTSKVRQNPLAVAQVCLCVRILYMLQQHKPGRL